MHRYLYFTVFISGMTTLAIELSASRLIGTVFGTSNLVWASIIGLILIYLALGYFLGGRWADRSPHQRTMYLILAWGAFTAGLVPILARPVLRMAANAFDSLELGVLFGSFAVVLVLFVVPVTLLGTISPFAIRLAITDPEKAGRVSGRIYAISTLGSFTGTFLPVLVFIPLVGTLRTFFIFSELLILVAIVGLWKATGWRNALLWSWMPVLIAILTLISYRSTIKNTSGQIYESESAYNYIQVLQIGDYRYLRLNEGQGIHSVWHPTQIGFDGPWKQFLVAPFFNQPEYAPERVRSMAIVGLAAGTTARQATEVFGPIEIDGYEIDPEIIQVGRHYFGMDLPNLNAEARDGRVGLEHSRKRYTIIGIDAYRPPYIPWHLTTQEFFQIVRDHLNEDGSVVINVGRSPTDRRLIDGLVATIQTIFPSIYVMDVPNTFNSIVYATVKPTAIENLYTNLLYLYTRQDVHPSLVQAMEIMVTNQKPLEPSGQVYTDDLAPIEWITNRMVLNFIFRGEVEDLE
ncbi:MAG TPA: fused MFS/spermidine synthase [Anaerolineales bacterium]|nr:fused MFS/spermidine synthase [Anaerolineales bacterium]